MSDMDDVSKQEEGDRPVEKSPRGRYIRFDFRLGSGAYKTMWKAYDTDQGIDVAWNAIDIGVLPSSEKTRIIQEVQLLQKLEHKNIINFYGSWFSKEKNQVVVITEIMTSGTLKSYIKRVHFVKWKIIKRWCIQILEGLHYLHNQNPVVIHRDLKCDNIFINGNTGDLRIGDLGLSTQLAVHQRSKAQSVLGTPEFMAPELYGESYDEKVDIYAFGMCVLEMVTREVPYAECTNPAQIYKKVIDGIRPRSIRRIVSQPARDFIELCLSRGNGEIDVSAAYLIDHPFLKISDDDNEMVRVLATDELEQDTALPAPIDSKQFMDVRNAESGSKEVLLSDEKMGLSTLEMDDLVSSSASHTTRMSSAESKRADNLAEEEEKLTGDLSMMLPPNFPLMTEASVDSTALAATTQPTTGETVESQTYPDDPEGQLEQKVEPVLSPVVENQDFTVPLSSQRVELSATTGPAPVPTSALSPDESSQNPSDATHSSRPRPAPRGRVTSYSIKATKDPENDHSLLFNLRMTLDGKSKEITFPFHLLTDSAYDVACELAVDVGISESEVEDIADSISFLVTEGKSNNLPYLDRDVWDDAPEPHSFPTIVLPHVSKLMFGLPVAQSTAAQVAVPDATNASASARSTQQIVVAASFTAANIPREGATGADAEAGGVAGEDVGLYGATAREQTIPPPLATLVTDAASEGGSLHEAGGHSTAAGASPDASNLQSLKTLEDRIKVARASYDERESIFEAEVRKHEEMNQREIARIREMMQNFHKGKAPAVTARQEQLRSGTEEYKVEEDGSGNWNPSRSQNSGTTTQPNRQPLAANDPSELVTPAVNASTGDSPTIESQQSTTVDATARIVPSVPPGAGGALWNLAPEDATTVPIAEVDAEEHILALVRDGDHTRGGALSATSLQLDEQQNGDEATELERYEMAGVQAMVFQSNFVRKLIGELRLFPHESPPGDYDAVRQLANEVNITTKNTTYGATALHWAAEEGDAEIAKTLITAGVDVTSTMTDGQTALHRAAAWGHVDIIALVLANGAAVDAVDKVGRSALHYAAFKGQTAAVKSLVDADADISIKSTALEDTALTVAAGNGHSDAVRVLLQSSRYVDVSSANKEGFTALYKAAASGHDEIVRNLLKLGADARAMTRVGDTALHAASTRGHLMVINTLLAADASVHAVNERGEMPLHRACLLSHDDVVLELIQRGASIGSKAQDGYTPFHLAVFAALHESCSDKTLRVLQLCVEAGAAWDEECDSVGGDDGWRGRAFGILRSIVTSWASQFSAGRSLGRLPIEVFRNRIEAAEAYDNDLRVSESTMHRRRVCALGSNNTGKSYFVQSILLPEDPAPTRMIDSVVGIEQSKTCFRLSDSTSARHDVTIWDFYGHDAFQVALAMFFTERTLFLICVDLEAYAIALMQADLMTESEKQYADWMGDFVETRILRWIRLVQDHHPQAEIVLVGTKADRLHVHPEATLKEIQADLKARLSAYANEVVRRLDSEHTFVQRQLPRFSQWIHATLRLVEPQVTVQRVTSFDWILPKMKGMPSPRSQLETTLTRSGRSFPMPELHAQVLECVTTIAEKARNARFTDNRIEQTFVPVDNLVIAIQEEAHARVARGEPFARVVELPREKCKSILRVLCDLGDVVWYHDLSPVIRPLDSTVIINPLLLIWFVVELLAHKPTDFLQRSQEVMPHGTLQKLPLWREVVYNTVDDDDTTSLMLPLKQLLAHFHIVSPATDRVMRKNSDLFVPAYWRTKTSAPWMFGGDDLRINPRAISSDEPVRIKWEYVFYKHLPDTFFDRFIMASHYFPYERDVGPDWTLIRHGSKFACRVLMGRDCITHRRIIRFEAVTATFAGSRQREEYDELWDIFQRWGEALERVVREYRGVAVDRFAFNLTNYPSNLFGAIRGFFQKPSAYARWLPPDLAWYREFIPPGD